MIQQAVDYILYESSYLSLYGLVSAHFLLLYLGLAPVFLAACKFLDRNNIVHKIIDRRISQKQKKWEILHSLKSVLVFGFSAFPIIYLVRLGAINLLPDTVLIFYWVWQP